MIYVSQGHELGIGVEIFLKSYLMLPQNLQKLFFLAIDQECLNQNLSHLGISITSLNNLQIHYLKKNDFPQSTKSLSVCLSKIGINDVLITLPTSKDQLIFNNTKQAGYTEFFRSYFNTKSISMVFKSFNEQILLLSDHISLNNVSTYITPEIIESKISTVIGGFSRFYKPIDEIIIAGINPHAGENGILGPEEIALANSLNFIKDKFNIRYTGFVSGDALHFLQNKNLNQLFVYMYHDQGLSKFKSENGLIGLNITMGLPFLRLSVDHGTAFDLYGKNKANITGMIYLLNSALGAVGHVN